MAMMDGVAWKERDGMDCLGEKQLEIVDRGEGEEVKRRGRRIILWRGILAASAG
jgi:hypothetical protein